MKKVYAPSGSPGRRSLTGLNKKRLRADIFQAADWQANLSDTRVYEAIRLLFLQTTTTSYNASVVKKYVQLNRYIV
jgi:hypothetical protein